MTVQVPTDINPNTIVSTVFHRFQGGVVLNIECNLCDNQTLFVNDIYTLLDFGDNGAIVEHPAVKFFDCYLEGYVITIIALDLKTNELLKRKHRINSDELPCNWVLVNTDIFNPKHKSENDLLEFCF